MERETEKSRLDNMFKDTSPEILKRKLPNEDEVPKKDSAISSPNLSSSYWRLKNQGDSNFDAKTAPLQKNNVDLIVNAYGRDYLREKEKMRYYNDLKKQLDDQKRRKQEISMSLKQMDEKDVRNKVKFSKLIFLGQ